MAYFVSGVPLKKNSRTFDLNFLPAPISAITNDIDYALSVLQKEIDSMYNVATTNSETTLHIINITMVDDALLRSKELSKLNCQILIKPL